MNRYPYIALVCIILSVSCEEVLPPRTWDTVVVDSLYQIDLPSNLKPGYDMHDYASLQYYDTLSEFFVLGIEDAKENLGQIKRRRLKLKGYYTYVENTVFDRVDTLYRETEQYIDINTNLHVKAGDYYVKSKAWGSEAVFYRIAIYENSNHFFQLVLWMPYDEHCNEVPWMDSTLRSFSFIPSESDNSIGVR